MGILHQECELTGDELISPCREFDRQNVGRNEPLAVGRPLYIGMWWLGLFLATLKAVIRDPFITDLCN